METPRECTSTNRQQQGAHQLGYWCTPPGTGIRGCLRGAQDFLRALSDEKLLSAEYTKRSLRLRRTPLLRRHLRAADCEQDGPANQSGGPKAHEEHDDRRQ